MGKVVASLSISYSALNKYLHPHCLALSRGLTNVQFTTMKIRILVLTLVSGQCLLDYVLCVSCVLHTRNLPFNDSPPKGLTSASRVL